MAASGWQEHKRIWFFSGIGTPFNTFKLKKKKNFTSHTDRLLRLSKSRIWIQIVSLPDWPQACLMDTVSPN